MANKPVFSITPLMLVQCMEITQILGKYEGLMSPRPQPLLRRQNRIRTIRDSLAIEGNTLSMDQVSAIFDGKKVLGPRKEILEVANAIRVYENTSTFNPLASKSLLKAHGMLMKGLVEDAGTWRSTEVGILKGSRVAHLAPRAKFVAGLMEDLFSFLEKEKALHPIIKSSIFHYELEFIHPFSDGNGRMGRLWQHIILARFHPLFENLPFESIIKKHQKKYYEALEQSDKSGDCTVFVDFTLGVLLEALRELMAQLKPEPIKVGDRLGKAKIHFGKKEFSRKDYIGFFKSLSTATASRDLQFGVKKKLLKKMGAKALSIYIFI